MPRFQSHTKRVASSSSSDVSVISNKSYRTTTSIIIFDAEKSLPTVLTVASDDDSSTSSSCSCHEDDENSCELLFESAATRSKAGQLLDLKRSSPSLPSPLLELDGTCSNSSTTRTPAKKAVYFGNVEIRHYIVTLGDNPMCLGPPVSPTYAWLLCHFEQWRQVRHKDTVV